MVNKNKILIIILIVSSQVFASGGSVYSRYGLGDLYSSFSAKNLSMGGLGTSMMDNKYVNLINPATWSSISNTNFGAGINSQMLFQSNNSDNAIYNNVRFLGFHVGLPVQKDLGISFVAGVTPYSHVNYSVKNSVTSELLGNYDEEFDGEGGISKLFFGTSYSFPFDLSLGAEFNYYTGNLSYKSSFLFSTDSDLTNSVFLTQNKIRGLGFTFGLESPDISKILGTEIINNLRIGLSYELASNINSDTSLTIISSLGETQITSGNSKIDLPSKLNLGLSFILNEKYLFALDYLYQPWSNFNEHKYSQQNLQNLSIFSFGFEIAQNLNKYASFWELVKYRGGLSYEQSQIAIGGEGLKQFGIHAGISFPLGLKNSIDLGFMYGLRGTAGPNNFSENIFQTSVSLNFGELWFIRRER